MTMPLLRIYTDEIAAREHRSDEKKEKGRPFS